MDPEMKYGRAMYSGERPLGVRIRQALMVCAALILFLLGLLLLLVPLPIGAAETGFHFAGGRADNGGANPRLQFPPRCGNPPVV